MKNFILTSSFLVASLLLTGAGCSLKDTTLSQQTAPEEKMMQSEKVGEAPLPVEMHNEALETEEQRAMEKKLGEMEQQKELKAEPVMMKESENKKDAAIKQPGSYQAYDASKLALANTGDVVLFFHAPWCPTCRAVHTDIEANLSQIPQGVTLLKVDYDSSTDLKKKYGVTYQHTFVQVDANGNMLKKWSGGNSLASVLGQIQ